MLDPVHLRVATFNIRNTTDRYDERKPLLAEAFASLDADIVGLQEVVFGDDRQDDFLASHMPGRAAFAFDARSARSPDFGNAILCRTGDVQVDEEFRLSHGRVVHRIMVLLPGNRTLWFANTHLHHRPGDHDIRREQAEEVAHWLLDAPRADALVLAGDFNARPGEPAYVVLESAGFQSAYRAANGREPDYTWPSGIQASTADRDGEPGCVDYLWLHGDIEVRSAALGADQPHPDDPTLYPSDHYAVVADVTLP